MSAQICSRCKVPDPPCGFYKNQHYCKSCAKIKRTEWYRNKPNRLEWRRAQEKPELRVKCEKRRSARAYALRLEMIAAYGGKCSCPGCEVMEPKFLSLEHLNGGGNAHRRKFHRASLTWQDLKNQGWPQEGYTLLCWCCQMAKTHFGICPHKEVHNVSQSLALRIA